MAVKKVVIEDEQAENGVEAQAQGSVDNADEIVEAADKHEEEGSVMSEAEAQSETQEKDMIKKLQEELAGAIAERDEYRDHMSRKVAELENFRKRAQQENSEIIKRSNFELLQRLLPIVDDLQRALEEGKKGAEYQAFLEGIELVYHKTMHTLEEIGVSAIDAVGSRFDVAQHEALMITPHEAPEGQVVQEVQRGFMYRGKVLRYAKVITSSGAPAGDAETSPNVAGNTPVQE